MFVRPQKRILNHSCCILYPFPAIFYCLLHNFQTLKHDCVFHDHWRLVVKRTTTLLPHFNLDFVHSLFLQGPIQVPNRKSYSQHNHSHSCSSHQALNFIINLILLANIASIFCLLQPSAALLGSIKRSLAPWVWTKKLVT